MAASVGIEPTSVVFQTTANPSQLRSEGFPNFPVLQVRESWDFSLVVGTGIEPVSPLFQNGANPSQLPDHRYQQNVMCAVQIAIVAARLFSLAIESWLPR